MEELQSRLDKVNWQSVTKDLNRRGYAILSKIVTENQCDQLIKLYNDEDRYRKTVIMERYRFGLGEYKYFDYPLPEIIQTIREIIYVKIVPIANLWMKVLKIKKSFPITFENSCAII